MKLTIIGSGRAASAFAAIWTLAGHELDAVLSRDPESVPWTRQLGVACKPLSLDALQSSEMVLFAVSDGAITTVYESVREAIPETALVWHVSGAHASSLFIHERRFSLHPLRSLPPAGTPVTSLEGTLFTWEGAESTRSIAEEIVRAAAAEFRSIETAEKPLYHAAAVFGSNFVAAMLEESASLMETAGVAEARNALATLANSAVRNWLEGAGASRFTGPVARGEPDVIDRHLEALAADPRRSEVYVVMTRALTRILKDDVEASDLHQIEEIIARNRQS